MRRTTGKRRALQRYWCSHPECAERASIIVESYMGGKLIACEPACSTHAPALRLEAGPMSYMERAL